MRIPLIERLVTRQRIVLAPHPDQAAAESEEQPAEDPGSGFRDPLPTNF